MNPALKPSLPALPPRSLTVISGGARPHEGFDTDVATASAQLLAALPAARRVLAIDCAPDLHRAYSAIHPNAQWTDLPDAAALPAATGPGHDLIVLGRGLRQQDDPQQIFEALAQQASEGAVLMMELDNQASLSCIERLIEADCTVPGLAPDSVARRAVTPATAFKWLMDAGWMPTLSAQKDRGPVSANLANAAWALADALNIPRGTASRLLRMERLLIQATRPFEPIAPRAPIAPMAPTTPTTPATALASAAGRFVVVVPTTREKQLQRNVEASPGLHEVQAPIVSYRHASSPAQALEGALRQWEGDTPGADGANSPDWVLLCHQDVYFPRGFGHRLSALLAEVPAAERDRTLIGFVGMAVDAARKGFEPAGFVIDRLERVDHPASASALSIDELAIVISRRSIHRIDPSLGWHLWATDLCLASICEHKVFPRIARLPLFHNSINDFQLPRAFFESAARLKQKYAGFGPIPTLCGTLDDDFIASGLAASRSNAS